MAESIDVFISHHTSSCLKFTEAICHSLEEKGIRVWYAPRDTKDSYAKNIVNVINECKVFILVLNHESSESFDVLNEINCVSERIRRKEPVHVIPFQISNDEISADAKYYLGRLHWLDAVTPPLERRIAELTDRVCYILNKSNSDDNLKDTNVRINELKSSDILKNPHFVGRTKELNELDEYIKANHHVFIRGIGGIGKSEIARKYAELNKDKYDTIIWAKYTKNLEQLIISNNSFSITNFSRIKNESGELENDKEYCERKLKCIKEIAENKRMLIIIDNFDTFEDEYLEQILAGNYDLIITTRNDFSHLSLPIIEITAMQDVEELCQLFYENCVPRKFNESDKKEIIEIIKILQGHTFAIELVAKYIQRSHKRVLDVKENLIGKGINPEMSGTINHLFQSNTVYQYIKIIFDVSKITETEKEILKNLSLFSIKGVQFDIFMNLCQYEDGFDIDELIRKNWIQHNWETDVISLHQLIIDVINNECKPNIEDCEKVLKNINKLDSWKLSQEDRSNYESLILNIYNNYLMINENNYNEFFTVAEFLRDLGYYEQAIDVLNKILEKQIEIYSEKSVEVAKTYNLLRFVNNKCYHVSKADEYNEKAIEILKMIPEEEYLLADYMKSRAYSYLKAGQPKEADKLLVQVNEIYNRILPEDHFKIGNMNIALSRLYFQYGNYEKSLECAEKAFSLLSKKYPRESVDVATSLMELGSSNCKLGNVEKGIEQLQETLRIRNELFHADDFSIMDAYEHLADGYIVAKRFDDARECLEIVERCFRDKVPESDIWYSRIKNKLEKIKE